MQVPTLDTNESKTMQREELHMELLELIRSTNWAADKQMAWQRKNGIEHGWLSATPNQLESAITYLRRFDEMFSDKRLDSVVPKGNNTGQSREERESLRIYLGEEE